MTELNFWVVTKATSLSTLGDILFETTAKGMILQALGGLRPEEIIFSSTNKDQALRLATLELERQDD